MIACFDVHYDETTAAAAALVFASWTDEEPVSEHTVRLSSIGDYEPGKFYLRELSPLKAVVAELPSSVRAAVQIFVIDAYCHLDEAGSPGLGTYFHRHLTDGVAPSAAVIGVAKNRFRGTTHAAEVLRGDSARPLFVTAVGLSYDDAADRIGQMDGEFRIPTLIKRVDRLCRDALAVG